LPFKIVLDGRIDNREELFSKLDINITVRKHLSDAAVILYAYAHWGENCLDHLVGDYAFVILDESHNRLLLARDPLGERTLFYAWKGTSLIVASEPWAVANAGSSLPELNRDVLPYRFVMKAPRDGRTLFKHVYEILPAQGKLVTASGSRSWIYWQPTLIRRRDGRTDEDFAEEFRELLEKSIRCRMRSTTPVGIQMSGGLDSGSLACLAASMLSSQPLTTISYIFDELLDCDERIYISAIKERWHLHSVLIAGDEFWPFKDWKSWLKNPNQPPWIPFQPLLEQVYKIAQQDGLRVLLTGEGGDQLYSASVNWLVDLFNEGRWREAKRELSTHIRSFGWRNTLSMGILHRIGRSFLNIVPGGRRLQRGHNVPSWLTSHARETLKENKSFFSIEQSHDLPGIWDANLYSSEIFFTSRFNIELRRPYRDRRLVEFALTLPAYQLYSNGLYKHILRRALQDVLPDMIRTRKWPTALNSLFIRGFDMEKTELLAYVQNPDANWRKFIRSDWLLTKWNTMLESGKFNRDYLVLWLCISHEIWYHLFESYLESDLVQEK
jgi:asparagine synthase (glutamine-hydrolysing)